MPLYLALDWLFVDDRRPISLRRVPWFLVYPAVWLGVVLVRGGTDGWVPYPFLDPRQGYGVVAIACVAIGVFITLIGIVVARVARVRLLRVERR